LSDKKGVPASVVLIVGMVRTVSFDDQSLIEADEVDDIGRDARARGYEPIIVGDQIVIFCWLEASVLLSRFSRERRGPPRSGGR
jgi:hypothetical protein